MAGGKISAVFAAATAVTVALLVAFDDFKAQPLKYTAPPLRVGALAAKPMRGAERFASGVLRGAESIAVHDGSLYTCTVDAKCVRVVDKKIVQTIALVNGKKCDGSPATYAHCGRPLGIRHWRGDEFLVVDATRGVYAVDFASGTARVLFDAKRLVGGLPQNFPDDLDILNEDTIFYSDASSKWTIADFMYAMIENGRDGRVIQLSLSSGKAEVLADGLAFPNGVQIHPDRQSVLVAESVTARILRIYFAGERRGQREVFCDPLPGLPDNIRLSADRRSFYVALFSSRWRENDADSGNYASMFDALAPHVWLRTVIGVAMKYMPATLLEKLVETSSPGYGVLIQMDLNGKIIDSYHDPTGNVIAFISQVSDDGGDYLYLGSFINDYIGLIRKH